MINRQASDTRHKPLKQSPVPNPRRTDPTKSSQDIYNKVLRKDLKASKNSGHSYSKSNVKIKQSTQPTLASISSFLERKLSAEKPCKQSQSSLVNNRSSQLIFTDRQRCEPEAELACHTDRRLTMRKLYSQQLSDLHYKKLMELKEENRALKECLMTKPKHLSVKMDDLTRIVREVVREKEKAREMERELQFWRGQAAILSKDSVFQVLH